MTSVWRRFPRIASRDYLAGDKPLFLLPVALIAVLTVSYITRPSDRRVSSDGMLS